MQHKKNQLRSLLCLLVMVLLASFVLGACDQGDNPPNVTDNGTGTGTQPAGSEGTTKWIDTLPGDLKYDGYDFVVGWSNAWGYNEIAFTYEDALGDTINAEIYERNMLTEEKLGITVSDYHMGDWDAVGDVLEEMSMLGDDAPFTVYCASTWFLLTSSLNDYLLPMNTIESIDYNNPWWDSEVIDMYSLDTDTFYFISGDINYNDDYALQCLYFNKKLMTEYQLELPYQKVKDGDWTLDVFNTYLKTFPVDNGDSVLDENDVYGIVTNKGALMQFANGFGDTFIVFENGVASINDSEKMFEVVDTVVGRLFSASNTGNVIVERAFGYEVGNQIFKQGKSLFTGGMIGSILDYRYNMEDDFGVVPYPKYNEQQDKYWASLNTAYGTAYAIMKSDANTERTGTILDVMGYYSQDTITKEIVEKNAIYKGSRDDDTADMLNMLFDCKIYDLGGWGTEIYEKGMLIVEKGINTYASDVEASRDKTLAIFEKTSDLYE